MDEKLAVAMSDKGPRYTVRLGEIEAGLTRIPLALIGRFVKGRQKFSITRATLADVVANFRRRPADTVIDYEHASERPDVAAGGPVPAAGWLKAVEDAPDAEGVLWGQAEFTPRAAELVKNGEYRYLSPVIDWGARDKRTGEAQGATLVSAALTNRPFLEALPAIAMSDAEWAREIDRGEAVDATKRGGRTVKIILTDRAAGKARVVQDDGTEATLPIEGLEAPPKVVRLSDVRRDGEGKMDFASLLQDGDALIAGDVFQAQQAYMELDAAIAKGLITPAQRRFYEKMALSDLAGFRGLVSTIKPVVDLTERGLGGGEEIANMDDQEKTERMLLAKVGEKVQANPAMQYGDALKLVAAENPDLNRRYTELSRRKMEGRE